MPIRSIGVLSSARGTQSRYHHLVLCLHSDRIRYWLDRLFEKEVGMILVTGGTGMLGSFVVRELQHRGQDVRIVARQGSEQIARELDAELALGDLADAGSLRRAAQGVTGIGHVACTFTQRDVDVAATETLLDAWDEGAF